jgi:phosphoribosylformylglycinamidine cyclo-ligase
MAHITGGGLPGNVPRILPDGLAAIFDGKSWSVPPIFNLIREKGNISTQEMYRVFNMGIGMILICAPDKAEEIINQLPDAMVIGKVSKKTGKASAIIE